MKKVLLPALGALVIGGASTAMAQLMLPGQPGYTGQVNRTLPPGSGGVSTTTGQAPYLAPGPAYGTPTAAAPVGRRGDLNTTDSRQFLPGELDEQGKVRPTRPEAARFAGERGPDGKLLPTYDPNQRAQATSPTQRNDDPQGGASTPPPAGTGQPMQQNRNEMQRDQGGARGQGTQRDMGPPGPRPGSGAADPGTATQRDHMMRERERMQGQERMPQQQRGGQAQTDQQRSPASPGAAGTPRSAREGQSGTMERPSQGTGHMERTQSGPTQQQRERIQRQSNPNDPTYDPSVQRSQRRDQGSGAATSGPQQQRSLRGGPARPGDGEPPNATALLNSLSAEGYRVTGNFERSGGMWTVPAVKDGQSVTVMVDPSSGRITQR